MATLSLLNRWNKKSEHIKPGDRRILNGIDEYRICISFSSDDSGIEIQINEEKFIQKSKHDLDLPILVNAEGCCSVRVFNVGVIGVQRYKFEVPTRTLLDQNSMVAALALFADNAMNLSPATTKEQLEALPFFSPNTILNSLNNTNVRFLDDEISKALPSLNRVCNRPRRSLIVERRVMPIDRARRIPPDAIEHLASRPELWLCCTATRITPARIRSEVPEETLDLYENRVAATLVRKILLWLAQRIRDVDCAYYQTETLHKSLFTGYQYNFRREQRIKTLWKLDTVIEQEYLQQYENSRELKDKISRQAAEISNCLDSILYKSVSGKPDVVSPLKLTNILTMDSDYQRIKQLWEVMDKFESSPDTPEQVSNQRDIQSDYACYVYGCVMLSLRWIGFLPAHTKPESFPTELDFNQALKWECWSVVVNPPEHRTFNINIEFIWQPMLNGTVGGVSQKLQAWRHHPTRIRLVVVPIARLLFGNEDEVRETLDALYKKSSLNQAPLTDNTPKRKNRQDSEVQTYVQLVHPTDPRDPNMGEGVPPELIQRMLNIGENFMHPDDYKSFVLTSNGATPNVGRIGCFPASPLDLNTLERFQRLFRFHTLGIDLLYCIHPSSCPVCDSEGVTRRATTLIGSRFQVFMV